MSFRNENSFKVTTHYINIDHYISITERINNKKIIPLAKNCVFSYVEVKEYCQPHPLEDFYFKMSDLSINSQVSLKWAAWAYFFFDNISFTVQDIRNSDLSFSKQTDLKLKHPLPYEPHFFLINDVVISSPDNFISIIDTEFNSVFITPNTKVRFKLKLNLEDFMLLQNELIPTIFFLEK